MENILEDCRRYFEITRRRVSFEYILLGMLNDYPEHAHELADQISGLRSHINLIPYNPVEGIVFQRPNNQRIETFKNILDQRGLTVTIRASRGLDQNAACGQLRRSYYPG